MKKSESEARKPGLVCEIVLAEVGKKNKHGEVFTEEVLKAALEAHKDFIDAPGELVVKHGQLKIVVWDKKERING